MLLPEKKEVLQCTKNAK